MGFSSTCGIDCIADAPPPPRSPHKNKNTEAHLQRRELDVWLRLLPLKTHADVLPDQYPHTFKQLLPPPAPPFPDAEHRSHMLSSRKRHGNASVHSTTWNLTFTVSLWKTGRSSSIHRSSPALAGSGLRPHPPGVPTSL